MYCERTHEEHVTDQLLMLVLLTEMNRHQPWQEIIKVMKATFLSSWEMLQRELRGFNLPFWVYKHGAFSKDFYRIMESLKTAGLVDQEKRLTRSLFHGDHRFPHFNVTGKGAAIVEQSQELLRVEPNAEIASRIVAAAASLAHVDPLDARKLNHAMTVCINGQEKSIDALPQNTPLITQDQLRHVQNHFVLDEDWLDTLDILLDPEYDSGAARRGTTTTYEELFAGV